MNKIVVNKYTKGDTIYNWINPASKIMNGFANKVINVILSDATSSGGSINELIHILKESFDDKAEKEIIESLWP